ASPSLTVPTRSSSVFRRPNWRRSVRRLAARRRTVSRIHTRFPSQHSLTSSILFCEVRVKPHRGVFTVALIGPDGAGKSTISRKVVEMLDIPAKYLYMGVNLEASNLMLPTTRLA